MTVRRVNRQAFDGTSPAIQFGRVRANAVSISYGDKIDPQHQSNLGSQAIDSTTEGAYSTERGKVKMEAVVFRAEIAPKLQSRGFGAERIPVVITYQHPDVGDDSDMLDGARIVGLQAAADAASNGALYVEFEIDYLQIYWTNERKTINRLDTAQRLGSSQF